MSRIAKIGFVKYKNILEHTEISLPRSRDYADVVVFVGKNGRGKSSILHAIYGCCEGCSIGDFWFDTALDEATSYQDYWYEYPEEDIYNKYDRNPQVRQRRILRKDRKKNKLNKMLLPNYWESYRPSKSIGMLWDSAECKVAIGRQRWPKFAMKPKYIDFRHNFTAFDTAVYAGNSFGSVVSNTAAKMQIMKRSKYLKSVKRFYYKRKINKLTLLSQSEIDTVNEILAKDYSEIRIIEHNYYGDVNYNRITIVIKNNNLSYSDAYAGSGESAIIQLVHHIMSLEAASIIILDEPESSLHVDAQRKLMIFLSNQSFKYKHQIFISTHSPFLIENEKISTNLVFTCSNDDIANPDKVTIKSIQSKETAFIEVGILNYKGNIYVEDELTECVVNFILKEVGYKTKNYQIINVRGFDNFSKHIDSLQKAKTVCIADGDAQKTYSSAANNSYDSKSLFVEYKNLTGSSYPGKIDNKLEDEQVLILARAIEAFRKKVIFIEYSDIEAFLLEIISKEDAKSIQTSVTDIDSKQRFREYMISKYGEDYKLGNQLSETQRILQSAATNSVPAYIKFKEFMQDKVLQLLD